jgi:hypothetical protein
MAIRKNLGKVGGGCELILQQHQGASPVWPAGQDSAHNFWVGLIATVAMTTLAILLRGNSIRLGGLGPFFAVVTAVAVLSPFCLAAVVVKRLHDLIGLGGMCWHSSSRCSLPF